MGKIVKYCAACEESFAEKFAFCPNCAQPLTAFEMNPVGGETEIAEQPPEPIVERVVPVLEPKKAVAKIEKDDILEIPAAAAPNIELPKAETPSIGDTKITASSNKTQAFTAADFEELESLGKEPTAEPVENDFVPETKTLTAAAGANGGANRTNDLRSNTNNAVKSDDGGYHITVIEEKNSKQRNGLLLGTLVVMVAVALGGVVYSIFAKDYGIGAIDGDNPVFLAVLDEVPPDEIEAPKPKKNDDEGGGGGGGGKEELEKPSKGRLVSQSEHPIDPPDAKVPQLTNPELKIIQETQGKIKRPVTEERAGLPGSDNLNPSNGTGRGGGIGTGIGTGIGSGKGTGEGSGIGSGSGSGVGTGNGPGSGPGSGGPPKPPPPPPEPKPVGPSEPLKIISRPQPKYTDAARQNQVTGTVTLKVTFSANGQITGVAPVNGLPYGLTEQAIAAARQIRFEPPKRNGVPYAVSKTVTYTFTIY